MCRDRGLGLTPAVVDEILGAETAQAWRRAARRRSRIAVASVVAALVITLALAALAYVALPDPSGPHYATDGPASISSRTAGRSTPEQRVEVRARGQPAHPELRRQRLGRGAELPCALAIPGLSRASSMRA